MSQDAILGGRIRALFEMAERQRKTVDIHGRSVFQARSTVVCRDDPLDVREYFGTLSEVVNRALTLLVECSRTPAEWRDYYAKSAAYHAEHGSPETAFTDARLAVTWARRIER